jgi:hypothetical protein
VRGMGGDADGLGPGRGSGGRSGTGSRLGRCGGGGGARPPLALHGAPPRQPSDAEERPGVLARLSDDGGPVAEQLRAQAKHWLHRGGGAAPLGACLIAHDALLRRYRWAAASTPWWPSRMGASPLAPLRTPSALGIRTQAPANAGHRQAAVSHFRWISSWRRTWRIAMLDWRERLGNFQELIT